MVLTLKNVDELSLQELGAMTDNRLTNNIKYGQSNEKQSNIDYDKIIYQALINEGKHSKVLNTTRPKFSYNDKDLRDAAHAEIAISHGEQILVQNGRKRNRSLDAGEKAKHSRDRNREHAKNTRLRKKAYVNKLKELYDLLNDQKKQEVEERLALGRRISETQLARRNAVRLFLSYRASNEKDRNRWATILDENVEVTMPITPYRSFRKSEIRQNGDTSKRVIYGIDAVMCDAASLYLMVESIGQGSGKWKEAVKKGKTCRLVYRSSSEDIVSAGDTVMCKFITEINGCDAVGGVGSCLQQCMLQCRFNRDNGGRRIVAAEFIFDVMGYMQQLQRASGIPPEKNIIPNDLQMALSPSHDGEAIVRALNPFHIEQFNEAWLSLCGIPLDQGDSLRGLPLNQVLNAYEFQHDLISSLASDCARGRVGSTIFMRYSGQCPSSRDTKVTNDPPNGTSIGHSGSRMVSHWDGDTANCSVPTAKESQHSSSSNTDSNSSRGTEAKESSSVEQVQEPLVCYLKLLPLTSNADDISHILVTVIELPLTVEERDSLSLAQTRSHSQPQAIHYPYNAFPHMLPSTAMANHLGQTQQLNNSSHARIGEDRSNGDSMNGNYLFSMSQPQQLTQNYPMQRKSSPAASQLSTQQKEQISSAFPVNQPSGHFAVPTNFQQQAYFQQQKQMYFPPNLPLSLMVPGNRRGVGSAAPVGPMNIPGFAPPFVSNGAMPTSFPQYNLPNYNDSANLFGHPVRSNGLSMYSAYGDNNSGGQDHTVNFDFNLRK